VISEVLRAAELSPADGRRLMATLRAWVEALTEIPEHPREGRPARQRAETRQARPRPPARIKEPPPRTRHDVGKTTKRELTLKAKRERTRSNGRLRSAHCCASAGRTSGAQTRPRVPEFGFPGSRSKPANHS
jgi:hypothetical protein